MDTFDLGYFAGLIDGEGTVSLTANRGEDGRRGKWSHPFVQMANTNYKIIDWCLTKVPIDGKLYHYDRHPERQKESWLIQWRGSSAVEVLRLIGHHLIAKRPQAELVLSTWDGELKWNENKRGGWCSRNPMPPELVELRIDAFNKIRAMNKKGPKQKAA